MQFNKYTHTHTHITTLRVKIYSELDIVYHVLFIIQRLCRRGVSHRRLLVCTSLRVRDTTLVQQRRCLPGHHLLNKGEPEVRWSHHRSWSDTSGRDRPGSKNSYPHASLELQPSVRLRVLVYDGPSASMARRGCRASCSRPSKRCFFALISSAISSNFVSDLSKSSS